jgi:hypothetical protein
MTIMMTRIMRYPDGLILEISFSLTRHGWICVRAAAKRRVERPLFLSIMAWCCIQSGACLTDGSVGVRAAAKRRVEREIQKRELLRRQLEAEITVSGAPSCRQDHDDEQILV